MKLNLRFKGLNFKLRPGYTLIEVMVVLTMIAVLAGMVFYNTRKFSNDQLVINAQREFIGNLRASLNRVNNGANGGNYELITIGPNSPTGYSIQTYNPSTNGLNAAITYSLPRGVTMSNPYGASSLWICPANPNLTVWPQGLIQSWCSNCSGLCSPAAYFACYGTGAVCSGYTEISGGSITINFTNGSKTLPVVIRGQGMTITSIDTQ